ncbi:helix-turn-helix protein [Herbihabitans rhizosphaerae]|uniref:Helix-turn-helix protein n=1 Tax=Herbihabitans rhizosphaerae TaxID=1872711 RepID=A0A4V2ERL5_9PSEU|nr:helix-turn-helix transcriptional regulator [Herbihabitans rhizosphaerae]RZS32369.1 helix-turn-helix protein [Herbihabitans rhizosphaerae]
MLEDGRIGERVRYWRLRRNLDRKQFADMVGRSTSWLDKIESGERDLTRLPMLERVAEVLDLDPSVLTDVATAKRTAQCVDATEVSAIRTALAHYPGVTVRSSDEVALPAIQRQADYLDHAWLASHFTVVARHLPALMRDAQTAVLTMSDADQVAAHRVLVTAYRLASSMLLKFEATDIAWLAADRAMHTALAATDTWSLARASRSVARAMASTHQRREAIAVLVDMTDRMRSEVNTDEHNLLSLYGMLYLASSITAAEQGDASLARAMHDEAMAAALRVTPHHDSHFTLFGQTNVLIHRVSALVRLHKAGNALEFAHTIGPPAVRALPPERRANYLLDLTEAHTAVGKYAQAARLLGQAEQTAPEEVRCRPLAHGLLRSLLNNTRGEPAKLVKQMADRAGVAA